MAGNKERQRAADRKLVAENKHLLPRVRGSERMAIEAEEAMATKATATVELPAPTLKVTSKVRVKQKNLVGGGVVHEMDVD